jgi:hypothetical protein
MTTTLEANSKRGGFSRDESRTQRKPESEVYKKLADKVGVATGGSTGMGFATAKRFVEEGTSRRTSCKQFETTISLPTAT